MIGISIGSMIGNSVGSVLTGFITPVASLSPVNLASALGAFIWAVTSLVFAVFVDRRQHPHRQDKNAREISPPEAEPSDDFRMAA